MADAKGGGCGRDGDNDVACVFSLDYEVEMKGPGEGRALLLHERFRDESVPGPDAGLNELDEQEALAYALAALKPKERAGRGAATGSNPG